MQEIMTVERLLVSQSTKQRGSLKLENTLQIEATSDTILKSFQKGIDHAFSECKEDDGNIELSNSVESSSAKSDNKFVHFYNYEQPLLSLYTIVEEDNMSQCLTEEADEFEVSDESETTKVGSYPLSLMKNQRNTHSQIKHSLADVK
jgi:hypothetical protein